MTFLKKGPRQSLVPYVNEKKLHRVTLNPIAAQTGMGNPPFKSSEGDGFDILRVWQKVTKGELQQVSAMEVLVRLKVRPEAFPSGSPMPVWSRCLQLAR